MDYIQEQKDIINKWIKSYLEENFSSKFLESAIYTIYPEGHRYRSLVGLEIYKMLNGDQSKFLKGIVGIEFIHHASLVFDDLPCMDNASFRKGKPTAHVKFGEDIAILGGLYLWNKGKKLMNENAREHLINIEEIDLIESVIYNAVNGMLMGQELDLNKEKNDRQLLESMYEKNRLFHLACVLPAYLLDKKEYLNPLEEIGRTLDEIGVNLSIGYQLFDDLRDIEGKEKITGKPVSLDVDKRTSVYRFGVDKVKEELNQRKEKIIKNIRKIKTNSNLEGVIEHILSTPS